MTKRIESTVKRWSGSVVISDPLTLPQVVAFQKSQKAASNLAEVGDKGFELKEGVVYAEYLQALIPGICACVEEWNLKGKGIPDNGIITPDNFPGTPVDDSAMLAIWLVNSIAFVCRDDEIIPKE